MLASGVGSVNPSQREAKAALCFFFRYPPTSILYPRYFLKTWKSEWRHISNGNASCAMLECGPSPPRPSRRTPSAQGRD